MVRDLVELLLVQCLNVWDAHHFVPVTDALVEEIVGVLLMVHRHVHSLIELHPGPHSGTVLDVRIVVVILMLNIFLCSWHFSVSSLTTPILNFFFDQLEELPRLFLGFNDGFLGRKCDEGLDAPRRHIEQQSYNFRTYARPLQQKDPLQSQDI